jgi:hypothetical protein
MASGGVRGGDRGRSLQRSSRHLDRTVQLVELLRRWYGGQGGLNRVGDEESMVQRAHRRAVQAQFR